MLTRLGDMLVERGMLSHKDLEYALERQKAEHSNKLLGQILVELKLIKEEQLLSILSEQLGIPFKYSDELSIDEELLSKIPLSFIEEYRFIPISLDGNVLSIASPNPVDPALIDNLRLYFGYDMNPILITSQTVLEFISSHKGHEAEGQIVQEVREEKAQHASIIANVKSNPEDKGETDGLLIKDFFYKICQEALRRKATFIYFKKYKEDICLYYKSNNRFERSELKDELKQEYAKMVSFIKCTSRNITGKSKFKQYIMSEEIMGTKVKIKILIIPILEGESILMELIVDHFIPELDSLIYRQKELNLIKTAIDGKTGLIIIAGPAYSHQIDTLYSILKQMNTVKNKILLLESISQSELPGIDQIELTLLGGGAVSIEEIRELSRCEPDVLAASVFSPPDMIKVLTEFSTKKHLAMGILESKDALDAVNVILDMGVNLYKLQKINIVIVAQRIILKICSHCREECDARTNESIIEQLIKLKGKIDMDINPANKKFFKAKGCEHCNHSGYSDNLPVYEVLKLNDALIQAVTDRLPMDDLKNIAGKSGFKSMIENAVEDLCNGVTTFEEIQHLLEGDS
ncbi:MAG: ATPase, T2SS/T4P/T4SS family [bacterium]